MIDLTLEITGNMPAQDAFPDNIYIQLVSHEESRRTGSSTPEDPFTSTWNYIGMVEHTGAHVDAFSHMDPRRLGVDKMPLDIFFGKAVCFDMAHVPEHGEIIAEGMEKAQGITGVKVGGHIVLLAAGIRDKYFPDKKILSVNPEITPEVIEWFTDHDSRLHGAEGPSTDVMNLNLSPSHRAYRSLGITHYEWLINLTEFIGKEELMFYGTPLRLKDGSGSPICAYVVIEE